MTEDTAGRTDLQHLSEQECWERLARAEVCRLAFLADGRIEVVPVNVAPRGRRLLLGSRPGSIVSRAIGGAVTLEVDGWTDDDAWSVVVRGPLLPVPVDDDRAPVDAWALKDGAVRRIEVLPIEVQGRRFDRHRTTAA
ncbi:MAG TPA: pyridoxamine 5'-phosphate oxidase family protein [Amnibacterium sp.]|jgi:nitroimidazol reductase NimA-like FMN-containing flavoprotein (pyridoxamine 5'-phosphate oxidase superfamily)|uniref:pyridoxamine 5'-phosphate oxidase family protein n=1 Tax=Amnibacterium sp. TaxID=1872496 RepID=UPI002F930C53